jgi:peptidoglycan/xylan/chitin deacetylase (PgdA/CDA1 family)
VHSHWHAPYDHLTEEGVNDDLERSRKAVLDATGHDPCPWLRLPYGSGATDEELLARLARSGYLSVYWNVDPRDWDPNSSARVVTSRVIDGVSRLNGPAVVLFHAWSVFTMTALPWIINDLSIQCEFVTVDDFDRQWLNSCGINTESYSKPHVMEKKNKPRAAS